MSEVINLTRSYNFMLKRTRLAGFITISGVTHNKESIICGHWTKGQINSSLYPSTFDRIISIQHGVLLHEGASVPKERSYSWSENILDDSCAA